MQRPSSAVLLLLAVAAVVAGFGWLSSRTDGSAPRALRAESPAEPLASPGGDTTEPGAATSDPVAVADAPVDPVDPDVLADLEADAAAIAEQLGLVDEEALDRSVERMRRRDPSLAPEQARTKVLADAAIVEGMVRSRYGGDLPPEAKAERAKLGRTLLELQDPAFRQEQLLELPHRLLGEPGEED